MDYLKLIGDLRQLSFEEIRSDSSEYFEAVFSVDILNQVHAKLEEYFGTPFKPAGVQPSKEAQKQTKSLGGIRADQTLFIAEHDTYLYYAMFWPWSNGTLITLKVAQYQRKES